MRTRKLSRWQKASAVVPIALLVGAWGAAITNTSLATASSDKATVDPGVPEVPTTAFSQPASVQAPNSTPTGIDPQAGPSGTLSTLSSNGIPAAALLAYKRAETLLAKADPECRLPWSLVAAIGRVESNHGRYGGNVVAADGTSRPGIFGIPLDGANNTARIADSDNGVLDKDPVWDRAVGPMQFIPSTWRVVGVDANGDGSKNPQDINDAGLATGVYLCAGVGDLGTDPGARAAVMRYNHSTSYVDLVMSIAKAYADGDYTQSPNGQTTPSVLTSKDHDLTVPRGSTGKPAGTAKPKASKPGSTSTPPRTGTPGSSTPGKPGGKGDGGGKGGDTGGDPSKPAKDTVEDTTDAVTDTVKDTAGNAQKAVIGFDRALTLCRSTFTARYPGADVDRFDTQLRSCATSLSDETEAAAKNLVGGIVGGLRNTVCSVLGLLGLCQY